MSPSRDDDLDRLLAQGRLGGPALDRVLEGAIGRSAGPRRRARWLAWLAPALALGGLGLVLARPDGFRAKGASDGAGAEVILVCGGQAGARVRCARGERLYFRVSSGVAGGQSSFLGAYAEPVAGGERVWFFAGALALPAGEGPVLAPRAVDLGSLEPGRYRVSSVVSATPLERAAIVGAPATGELEVLP